MSAESDFSAYKDALVVLGTAGVAVPLLHRFRISPVLGFLFAGAALSPHGLGLLTSTVPALDWITISSPERVAKLAELGVVFLLFLIGLELSFERLLTMRRLVFGLGSLQVLTCGAIMGALALWLGEPPTAALVIGAALSLSSTAVVIEVLAGQKRLATATGRTSFAILLFQDLAVVPILFLIGVLDPKSNGSVGGGILTALAQAGAALILIVTIGRYLLQPLFRLVAQTNNQDMFIATTLFVAVGTSFATALSGLSMALGAFVAGLLLAETEYRRAVEATIEPIKSLLLGVFFFSVGLSLDLGLVVREPAKIATFTLPHLILQGAVIFMLARMFGVQRAAALESAALLAPGGEFAFVVLTLALSSGLVAPETTKVLLTSVALSMALIPLLGATARKINARMAPPAVRDPELAALPSLEKPSTALVVGYGRVGQLTGDMLETHGVSYVAVDHDARLVSEMRRKGKPVYFGDVRQLDFLERCGLGAVKATIITIHTQSAIDSIVTAIRSAYPKLVIVARAKDATHARQLYTLGVTDAVPETIEASLQLSEAALVGLGVPTGVVIASIHEKRDEFRAELQGAAKAAGKATRALPGRKRI
ncbi:MAG: cation:proton antiporter domain-containing protein [Hyphomicrobium sp.]